MEQTHDAPTDQVLRFVDRTGADLRAIADPAARVAGARAVRAAAKRFESLAAEITREAVQQMRATGMTFEQIGERIGVTRARAQQLTKPPRPAG